MKFKIEEEREVKNGTTEGNHTSSNKLRFALTIAILHNQFWVSNDHNMSLRMSAKFAPKEAKKAPAKDPEVRTVRRKILSFRKVSK